MTRLHLLITGLCPDFGTQTEEVLAGLAVPALRTLLGRGRRLQTDTDSSLSARLARLFQLPANPDLPFAPLRLQADGLDPGGQQWWCADPVHLQLMLDHLRLGGGSAFSLDAGEAAALLDSLNRHFAGEVEFVAPHPLRWYARFPQPITAQTTPLDQARGRSVGSCLPQGPHAGVLQRLMNESQMLLHAHPVNQRRESLGLEPVNSLWFWGGGLRVNSANLPIRVWADDPMARALARTAGAAHAPLPPAFVPTTDDAAELLVALDSLHPLSCDGRMQAWQVELERLEAVWFRPLLAALQRGRVAALRLESLGHGGQALQLGRLDAWKVWRTAGVLCRPINP